MNTKHLKGNFREFSSEIINSNTIESLYLNNRCAEILDYNSLDKLPLKNLSIDNCNIKTIPDLRKLTLLESVNLSSNLINDIPDHLLECDSIVKLDLRYNEFKSISKKIFTMKRLCCLSCVNTEFYYKYNDIVYFRNSYNYKDIIDSTVNKIIIENCHGFENILDNLPNNLEYLNIYNLTKPLLNLPPCLKEIYIYNKNNHEIKIPYGAQLLN
jgi:Leucine-rich repeat (LRR) protein